MADFEMPRVRLGIHGFEVSKLGYGCMGLSGAYNSLVSDEDGIAIIKYAFSKGITFFDTSDIYGVDHSNEILVGKMGELKKLMEESKIKYIGLSEASPNTIRRAHAVHPMTALQMKYYLLTRDIEEEIIPLCRELGIVKFPYSPTAHGFFVGKAVVESVPTDSFLLALPRFTGQNLDHNKIFYLRIDELSKKHSCTPAQLALAWVIHQGDDTMPIPGTTKTKNLDENIGALRVKLTEDDLKEISDAVPILEIVGPRIYKSFTRVSYIFADTPLPKNSK